MHGGLYQFVGHLRGLDVALRQLVGTEQVIRQPEPGVGGQHMGLEMHAQCGQRGCRNWPGGDLEARPGEQGGGNQHHIESAGGLAASGFNTELDHVDQLVVAPITCRVQLIKRGSDRAFVLFDKQSLYDLRQAGLPELIFKPGRGLTEFGGQLNQQIRVRRLLGAAGKAGSFHWPCSIYGRGVRANGCGAGEILTGRHRRSCC